MRLFIDECLSPQLDFVQNEEVSRDIAPVL